MGLFRAGSAHGRVLAGGVIVVCLGYWLWLRQDGTLHAWTTIGVWLVGFLLSLSRSQRVQTSGVWMLALLVWVQTASWYVGRGTLPAHFARLDESPAPRFLLVASTLTALVCSGVSVLESAGQVAGRCLEWLALRPHTVVYAVFVVVAASVSADLFFVGRGARYDLQALRPNAVFGPGSGTYAGRNVLEREVSDNRGNLFVQRKPPGVVRIVLEGASTMWGAGLENPDAPNAVLQRMLREQYPDRRFEVIQMALPGKTQEGELIDTVLLATRWDPDLIVSWNGFNDVWHHASDQFESQPFWLEQADAAIEVRTLERIFFETTHSGPLFWQRKLDKPGQPQERLFEPDLYTPPRFFSNLEATARHARDAGARYAFSVTPNTHEFGADSGWRKREFQYMRRMAAEILTSLGQTSFDIREAFSGRGTDGLFFDNCHLTKQGVELLCSWMAARIPDWLSGNGSVLLPVPSIVQARGAVEHLEAAPNSAFLQVINGELVSERPPTIGNVGGVGLFERGPRMRLEVGKYRVEWWGRVTSDGPAVVDVVRHLENGGTETLLSKNVDLMDKPDTLLAALSFDVEKPGSSFEPRLNIAAPTTKIELERLLLFRLARTTEAVAPLEWRE